MRRKRLSRLVRVPTVDQSNKAFSGKSLVGIKCGSVPHSEVQAVLQSGSDASSVGHVGAAARVGPARFTDAPVLSELALSGAREWRSVPFGNRRAMGLRILIACL